MTSTATTTKAAKAAAAASKALAARVATDITESQSVETLTKAFTKAHNDFDSASSALDAAAAAKASAQVWMSRISYLTSVHPAVSGGAGKQNMSEAARKLGMAYGTLRPYILAGEVLARLDRIGILADPTAEDIKAVKDSIEETANARRRELNARAKAKAVADAAKLAALESAATSNGNGSAPVSAPASAPVSDSSAPATDSAPTAGSAAESAPSAPVAVVAVSLTDDLLATAKRLVAIIRELKKDKAAWTTAHPKMLSILGQAFPALKA